MTKLAAVFEAFLGIILTLSMLTFGWAYIDGMHTLDATPLSQITGQDIVVSESVLNAPAEPVEAPQSDVPIIVVDDNEELGPESYSFTTYTQPSNRAYRNHRSSKKTSGVDQDLADDGEARVIVSFSEPSNKAAVKSSLESQGAQTNAEWSDGLAVTASKAAIDSLENDNSVAMIEEDLPLQTMTYEGFDLIDLEKVLANDILTLDDATVPNSTNLTATGSLSLTGAGQTVAIIDSGLYSNHPEFSGKVLDEWDFYENDTDAQDSWNHGTKMAGIIAAKGVFMDGVAPDANIVSLKITNSTGGGWRSDLINALDWVLTNGSQYNITTVYIGLGHSLFDGSELDCTLITGAPGKIDSLVSKNVTVVAPSGHDSNSTMIAFPACVANTISVGAVPDGGVYPADTWDLDAGGVQSNRRDGLLDLLAPGGDGFTQTTQDDISYDYIGGTGTGTSVAAAYVAGASILLREYWDARNWDFRPAGLINGNIPNTIEYIFKQTGKQINDTKNPGVSYPRLNMSAAINYEENKPVVSLETANETTVAPGTIALEYNVTDQHSITSCSLYINGALNQTDSTITKGITQSFSVGLGEATYTWKIECADDATVPNTGVSAENTLNVVLTDTEAPKYSSLSATPNTYAPSQTYSVKATWTDNVAVDDVILQFNGVNYTDAVKAGNVYTRNFTNLAAGTYNYVWYANDTSGNENDTGVQVFTINKATTALSWNTTPGWTVLTGTQTTVHCVADNSEVAPTLERNGTPVTNPNTATLAVGTYNYTCTAGATQNYTAAVDSKILTVTNKNPSTATLVFDKASPKTYGTAITATCTDTNPEADAKLYRDGVDVTATENGTSVTLAAGTYNYVCNVSETATYTAAEDTDSFTINKASTNLSWNTTPGWSVITGTQTTVQCLADNAEVSAVLTKNGTGVSNPDIQTLAVGTYNYTCTAAATQNYTADVISNILAITSAPDTTPPGSVTGLSSTSKSTSWIFWEWTNPADPDLDEIIIFINGINVANVTGESYNATGLSENTSYTIKIHTVDTTGNVNNTDVTDTVATDIAADVTPPVISNVDANSITNDSAAIDWDTNEPANSSVNYGTTLALGMISDNSGLFTSHGENLYNLIPNTTYYFNVTSCDAAGNCATEGTFNFTTLPNSVNIPPTLSGLPDQVTTEDAGTVIIFDLRPYATDPDGNVSLGVFSRDSQSNPSLIDCLILHNSTSDYALCLQPEANQTGYSDVTIMFTDEGGASDNDTFRVTVNPVDDPAYWNALSNQAIDEDSADGTVAYTDLMSQCIDIDSAISMSVTSTHTHYDLAFSGNDLVVNNLEANWYGTETVNLDCNGVANSFDLTVNDVAEQTCYTVCTYGNCWTYCE